MKKLIILLVLFSSFLLNLSFAQSNFSVQAYKDFLSTHQNMSSEELLQMYSAGQFISDINVNADDSRYFDSIKTKFNLTPHEIELLGNHGFVVSERLNRLSFGEAFLEIFHKDLPVYISTDAILHAFHISYDRILTDIELGILISRLKHLLLTMHGKQNLLAGQYSSNPQMQTMLNDVDIYVTIPLRLLGENVNPYYSANSDRITQLINKIYAEQMDTTYLFSSNCKSIDWSQFKPRGHYTNTYYPELAQYFRAMMWLGRTELYLSKPSGPSSLACLQQTFYDIQRQTIDAVLVRELFELSGVFSTYEEIEDILKFMIGDQDNVNLDNMQFMKNAVGITNALQLLDSLKLVEFQDTLANQSFANQLILSQIILSNPMSPDSIVPASAFLLFGQRFVLDSYVTASVVFDRIKYMGNPICRLVPSTLDVLFAAGNSASGQLLEEELNAYHYSSNLAALRYLIDSYDNSFWNSSIYNMWLNSIRQLNVQVENRETLPDFMQTAAFWQKMMNTQLASWTELRHDNLLYAKQSYTGGSVCSYPYGYVEPFPDFYQSLKTYAGLASAKLSTLNFPDPFYQQILVGYYNDLYSISDTLKSISIKELNGQDLTQEEKGFLTRLIYNTGAGSGPEFDGWYTKLYYRDHEYLGPESAGLMTSDHIVADIHTTPTSCGGALLGWISHVGTGSINLGVVTAIDPDGIQTSYVGPFMSYYEYRTSNFLRLTDEEWDETYLQLALRPQWVNLYLADSSGNSRGTGPSLITSVELDNSDPIIPESEILLSNYPNPFNPYTIISFTIPTTLTNSSVQLNVYDVQGRLVKQLVNEKISAGNYLTKWYGDDNNGSVVTSGVYLYRLMVGDHSKNGKMILLK